MIYFIYLVCFLIISCDLPSEANKDCNGVQGGSAKIDTCGVCDGNNINIGCDNECFSGAEFDECGECAGDNSSCSDCLNIPYGNAELDECQVCNGSGPCLCPDQTSSCDCCCQEGETLDCLGECNGSALLDDCGICESEAPIFFGTSPYDPCGCGISDMIDSCGNCNGDGFVDCMCAPINGDYAYIQKNDDFNCDTQGSPPYQLNEYLSCETLQTEFDICYPEDCGSVKLADFEGKNILIIYEFDW